MSIETHDIPQHMLHFPFLETFHVSFPNCGYFQSHVGGVFGISTVTVATGAFIVESSATRRTCKIIKLFNIGHKKSPSFPLLSFILFSIIHFPNTIGLVADFLFKLAEYNFCSIKKYIHPKRNANENISMPAFGRIIDKDNCK